MTILGMSIVPEPLLRQKVTEAIRASIAAGNLVPGQKLVEREICGELGISRTVLREALQHLEAEGLIVNRSRRGRSVACIGRQEATEIYAVRRTLEDLIARSFVETATPVQVNKLKACLHSLRKNDAGDALAAEAQFFVMMRENCGNQVAADFARQLDGRMTILKRLSASLTISRADRLAELDAIMASIVARDCARAGELCSARIDRLSAGVIDRLADAF